MRVLFTSWGWPSHFFPLVQLGWALQAAGHEVQVASQPGLSATITEAGLTAVAVGSDVDVRPVMEPFYTRLAQAGRPVELTELLERFGAATVSLYVDMAANMLADTMAFASAWRPDLVVHEPTTFAGPLVAGALGVPSVRHLWGMDVTYPTHVVEPAAVEPLARSIGLSTVDTLGVASISPCPPSLQLPYPVRRLPMRYVPYNGPATLPRWLWEPPARPRVCVTQGTVAGRFEAGTEALDRRVVDALDGLDLEVVVVNPSTDPPARAGVRVVDRLALHLLLPSCALVIHSGGGGLAMTAIASGTSQLLLARNPDHLVNARRLDEVGAGRMLFVDDADPAAIHNLAIELIEQGRYAKTVAALRDEMAEQPSAGHVVRQLAELAQDRVASSHAG